MASDLSSLVFKLLMLSSCMLVGGQNCSISGTMQYLYVWLSTITGLDYTGIIVVQLVRLLVIYAFPTYMTSCRPSLMQVSIAFVLQEVGVSLKTVALSRNHKAGEQPHCSRSKTTVKPRVSMHYLARQ